jgi:hypothetical protein
MALDRAALASVLWLALSVLVPSSVLAQDLRSAEAHFNQGVEFYQEGALEAALEAFQQAYDEVPNFRVLFNIAQVHYALNDYASSLRALERYLAEGGDRVPSDRRSQVADEIERLRERVGTLQLRVEVDGRPFEGAEVVIDDRPQGSSPIGPLALNLGWHRVTVSADGYTEANERARIRAGATTELVVQLVVPASAEPSVPSNPRQDFSAPLIVTGVATGLLAAATVTMGVLSLLTEGELVEIQGHYPIDFAAEEDTRTRLGAFVIATDVLLGVSIAAAGAFVITLALDLTSGGGDTDSETEVTVGLGSVTLVRHF